MPSFGDVPDAQPAPGVPIGLWERTPAVLPAEQVEPLWWWRFDLLGAWQHVLSSGPPVRDDVGSWAINATLNEAAVGAFDFATILERARSLLVAGKLSMSQSARAFEDLFLGGAMSRAWPVALAIADAACAGARRPAGVEGLLRMLTRYACEATEQNLPTHIESLARGAGETKAEQEARALGAALAREPVADYVGRLRASVGGHPRRRSVACGRAVRHALPMSRRVSANDDVQLAQLRLAAEDHLLRVPRPARHGDGRRDGAT